VERIASHLESIDISTPMGKMVFTVIAAVAELERSLICERVAMSLQRAKAQGKRLGRPAAKIDPAEVHGLREQGMSFRVIARQVTPL
jgi:putative DNA-invertase from lambdoid prophage Rac